MNESTLIGDSLNRDSNSIVGPSDHYGINHVNGRTNRNDYYKPNGVHPVNANGHENSSLENHTNNGHTYSNHSLPNRLVGETQVQNRPDMMYQCASPNETKLCVIVDSRTPVQFKVPIPSDQITLSDLKTALPSIDRPNFKYFFKMSDSEFGIVKEEIQENDARLPLYKNRVVAWIVTPGETRSARTRSEEATYSTAKSYDECSSSLMTTDIDSTSYMTESDEESVSCTNFSETSCETFISQRRNRNYEPKAPLYQQHHRTNVSSPYRQYDRGNLSTPSSSSASDATAVQFLTVHLVLTNENFLGLHVYANDVDGVDEGIYVDSVTDNSAVALDGRIEPGDKLIQVNDVNLEELSNEQAVKVLKDAVNKRGPLKLVVAKFVESTDAEKLLGTREAIHPIDTAAWVAHAQAMALPICQDQSANSATSSPSFSSNALDTDCIRPASGGILRLNSGLRLNRMTSDTKDIIHHMKLPEVGLDIRDREWLKIRIPQAFLGSELVAWLERNVYGFSSNRDAKKFASRMLRDGHISNPISKRKFSSKSYYTFVT